MIPFLIAVCAGLSVVFAVLLYKNNTLRDSVARANEESNQLRRYCESEKARVYAEAQTAVAEAQKLIDEQVAEMKQESERIRHHYEGEARRSQESAEALVAKTLQDVEPLRKYAEIGVNEAEAQRQLLEAIPKYHPSL